MVLDGRMVGHWPGGIGESALLCSASFLLSPLASVLSLLCSALCLTRWVHPRVALLQSGVEGPRPPRSGDRACLCPVSREQETGGEGPRHESRAELADGFLGSHLRDCHLLAVGAGEGTMLHAALVVLPVVPVG